MNRRQFLAAASSVGIINLAGCNAISDDNTDELKRRLESKNETIADLRGENTEIEQQVSELEQERDEFEQQVSDLEEEIANTEDDVSKFKQQRETLVTDRIVSLYQAAERFYDLAEQSYSEAATAIENEEDSSALNQFRASWGRYDATAELTFQAATLADNEGFANPNNLATESNSYALNMRDACNQYAVAAQNYILGNIEQGNSRLDQGDTEVDEAGQYTFVSSSVFENSIST